MQRPGTAFIEGHYYFFNGIRSYSNPHWDTTLTIQTPDQVIIEGTVYNLHQVVGTGLFFPQLLGMQPCALTTACYRGFYVTYTLLEDQLLLQALTLREKIATTSR